MRTTTTICAFGVILLLGVPGLAQDADGAKFYRDEILPILEAHCLKCHGGGKRVRGGLKMTTHAELLKGGDTGPSIDLKEPAKSHLLAMISYRDEDHAMPPKGKLADEMIAKLERWVKMGAPYDASLEKPETMEHAEEPKKGRDDGMVGWSYRPVKRPDVPTVKHADRVASPIDAFLEKGREAAGLSPAPEAEKITLIRRATYDLIGLPPTPEEVAAFLADESPDAFMKVVERLLASPHYGERWGRHWLDLVRYAETNGYERDTDKPHIWRYRDWAVRSFNQDKPYDRMILEQLAGDELDDPDGDAITATAYYRLMIWDDEPGAGALQARYDTLDDVVRTTSGAFLGMTLGCARCHDHKGDPIPQEDYYSFMAFFHGITDMSVNRHLTDISPPDMKQHYETAKAERERVLNKLRADIAAFEDRFRQKLFAKDNKKKGRARRADLAELKYRFYRDTWDRMPEFDMLRPETTGKVPTGFFDLTPATRRESIGFVFEGKLRVPAEGRYEFFVRSHRPVKLSVGGKDVIGHETPRRRRLARAIVDLTEGYSDIRLDYFNKEAREYGLRVWWRPLPASPWRYVTEGPIPEGWEKPEFDDSSWSEGLAGFGTPGTPNSVVGTEWTTKDIWMRREFSWSDKPENLRLALYHDDNIRVYINGVFAAKADGYHTQYTYVDITEEARRAIKQGKNLIAVHGDQDFGGQFIHVEPVRRSLSRETQAVEAAFGREALSFDAATDRHGNIDALIRKRGQEIVGNGALFRWQDLKKRLEQNRRASLPPRLLTPAVQSRGRVDPPMHVHVRGNAHSKGKQVEPRFPRAVSSEMPEIPEPPKDAKSSHRRRFLAEWIASPENPLTARVMVNRIWHHHFGRGIVASTSDFGELGERPTHPDLLDWLASEFVERGWSIKAMHRLIMASKAYRMSSRVDALAMEKDPTNKLRWRFDMRRLGAEEIRDSVIAVTGRLNDKVGGKSFFSMMPKAVLATSSRPNEVWGKSSEEEQLRRSLYIKVKRSLITPIMTNFDFADTDQPCPERFVTTHPGQALGMINGDFMARHAAAFAKRLEMDAPGDVEKQVRIALALCTAREPTDDEVASHVGFIADLKRDFGLDASRALGQFCLAALNMNEFLYLD